MVAQLDGIGEMSRYKFDLELVLVGVPIPVVVNDSQTACGCAAVDFVLNGVSVGCCRIIKHHQVCIHLVDNDRSGCLFKTVFAFLHDTIASA